MRTVHILTKGFASPNGIAFLFPLHVHRRRLADIGLRFRCFTRLAPEITACDALIIDSRFYSRRWTRDEYYQMGDQGMFQDQRVQLIEGEIVVMSPQKVSHYAAIDKCRQLLEKLLGENFWIRTQGPLTLGPNSEPEPDVSIVAGTRDDYQEHPTTGVIPTASAISSCV